MLLNMVVLVILLNLFLEFAFFLNDQVTAKNNVFVPEAINEFESYRLFESNGMPLDNGKRTTYQLKWFDYTAYEQIVDERYAGAVLDEFFELAKLGFPYQPWVQFAEPSYNGKHVNVDCDSKGFPIRRTLNPQKEQSSVFRVFILGGSTTFGYNVSDGHTWPSFLSDILNQRLGSSGKKVQVEVMNYGRGFYFPSQETALLIDLFRSGHRPNLVIFMDGVNWGEKQDIPQYSKKIERAIHDLQVAPNLIESLKLLKNNLQWMPMLRLAGLMKHRFFKVTSQPGIDDKWDGDQSDFAKNVVVRFRENRKIAAQISALYGAKVLFFLQPDATYNYPINLYRLSLPDSFLKSRRWRQQFYNQIKKSPGALDFTGLFDLWGKNRKAIVDDVHYSPGFNRFLAGHVAEHIDLASLITESLNANDSEPAGASRRADCMAINSP
ncbi:MAG: hypothetical protein KC592_11730 [Nitrospira sp.]|nr:hypothetical protein [Nitrospira sp.]MCW5785084.1 hypothetical protein [Nitrospirales bacterium]